MTPRKLFAIAVSIAGIVAAIVVAYVSYPKPVHEISVDYVTYPSVYAMANNSSHIIVGNTSQFVSFFALIQGGSTRDGPLVLPLNAYRLSVSTLVKGAWPRDHVWVVTNGGQIEYGGVIYRYSDSVELPSPAQIIVFLKCQNPPPSWTLSVDLNSTFGYSVVCYLTAPPDAYYEIVDGILRTHDSQTGTVRMIDSEPVDGMALAEFLRRIAP
ncbi:MAG: hypothetical protein ACT4OI_00790 [Methanobacteriota archaeon]